MVSNGVTAQSTTSDTAITVIAAAAMTTPPYHNVGIIVTGTVTGFFSIDGGHSWTYLPASVNSVPGTVYLTSLNLDGSQAIMVKRIASGSNVTGIYAFVC